MKVPGDQSYYQEELNLIKGKYVKHILTIGPDFYIICCKDYDKDLDVYCTSKEWMNKHRHYKLSIDRRIEPNSMRVFDCFIMPMYDKMQMGILSARDQLGFYDIVEYS